MLHKDCNDVVVHLLNVSSWILSIFSLSSNNLIVCASCSARPRSIKRCFCFMCSEIDSCRRKIFFRFSLSSRCVCVSDCWSMASIRIVPAKAASSDVLSICKRRVARYKRHHFNLRSNSTDRQRKAVSIRHARWHKRTLDTSLRMIMSSLCRVFSILWHCHRNSCDGDCGCGVAGMIDSFIYSSFILRSPITQT